MKLGWTVNWWSDEDLIYTQQLGISHVVAAVTRWDPDLLSGGTHRVRVAGLQIAAVEGLPRHLVDAIRRGPDRSEAALERVAEIVRLVGEAGIPILSLQWSEPRRWTRIGPVARGSALARIYEGASESSPGAGPIALKVEDAWQNLGRFLSLILPVAERYDVQLALRLDDPPAAHQREPRILGDVEGMLSALALESSEALGLDVWLGTLCMLPGDALDALGQLLATGRVLGVRLDTLQGNVTSYHDVWPDETAPLLPQTVQALRQAGFQGVVRAGTPPQMDGDTAWRHIGQAYNGGYLRALLQAF
jgi:D-mannonate dehydratase